MPNEILRRPGGNWGLRKTLPALALILLSGCGHAVFSSDDAPVCPPMKQYDDIINHNLAAQIDAAPPDAVWPEIIADYYVMRCQCTPGCEG